MPIVPLSPRGEVSPQPIPDIAPHVPAAGDISLFGGNRSRDLQAAGQNLGQASDSLFALYERTAREANDIRVQDLTNRFLDGRRAILQSYSSQTGADAIAGADAASANLTSLKDEVFGQTANGNQRQRLAPILDAHLAASTADVTRHAVAQQEVYSRGVATKAIETSRAEAIADPSLMDHAVLRAEGAARALHAGQPPEAIESGARNAGGSVIAGVIGDRLARNDPMGVMLFKRYADRLDPSDRHTLGAAVETLSNSIAAATWLRDRGAGLRTPAPTGDAALDAVNAASASTAAPLPVTSSAGRLLDEDGIVGTRERLDEIDNHGRALTALNQREFAANPTRLRANQAAIDIDIARSRATVKADADTVYADLRQHLTTGGPNGGTAVTPPPATIMSRLTDEQQDAVIAKINRAIIGIKTRTDPQTFYAIRQGLTGDNADERQRWASKNLVQFMGRLSDEDFAALEKLQMIVRSNDGGAQQSLQLITRMADQALWTAGIDPTPRPDAAPGSDAAQAARFHRALQDELSALESSKDRTATAMEAYGIVKGLKDKTIKSGWLKVSDRAASPTALSDIPLVDDAFRRDGTQLAQAEPPARPTQNGFRIIGLPEDFESFRRQMEEYRRREADEQAVAGIGGAPGAPTTEPYPGSPEHETADAQARAIVAQQDAEGTGGQGGPQTGPPPGSPEHLGEEAEARKLDENAWNKLGFFQQLGVAFERLDEESKKRGATLEADSKARHLETFLELQRRRDSGDDLGVREKQYLLKNRNVASDLAGAVRRIIEAQRRLDALPMSDPLRRLFEASSPAEVGRLLRENPGEIAKAIGIESVPALTVGLIAMAALGPVGGAVALTGTSGIDGYAKGLVGALARAGIDISNADALTRALQDKGLMERVRNDATTAGAIEGGATALLSMAGPIAKAVKSVSKSGAGRVTVYRVEGTPNARFAINEQGHVMIEPGSNAIWLNFGRERRAINYFNRKVAAGLPGPRLKSFEVDSRFLDELRSAAIPERLAKKSPSAPIISRDPYPDQFGI